MHVWALGLTCETPAALGPSGLHTTARELQTCTFQGPGASNTTKNSTRRHPERDTKKENCGGEGKKSAKFWASHLSPPTLRALSGPHPSGPQPFVVQKFNIPKLAEVELAELEKKKKKTGRSRNWTKSTALFYPVGGEPSPRCPGQSQVERKRLP